MVYQVTTGSSTAQISNFPLSFSMVLAPAMSLVNDYGFLVFCIMHLESVFRWRLSSIKILLELELEDRQRSKAKTKRPKRKMVLAAYNRKKILPRYSN